MKKRIVCAGFLIMAISFTHAQTGSSGSAKSKKSSGTSGTSAKKSSATFSAVSTSSYSAKADAEEQSGNFTIADPIILALNTNANGGDVRISNSGIVGMPKRAYGFANGHLYLSNRTATGSGTITGNGSVGTGSSLGSIGSYGPHMHINGKSTYAGSNMWGNAQGMILRNPDANVRQAGTKED